jgi:spoIIIJ-associated protein
MRQVEIQARSVEEAVRLALEQMGRTREQVDVQVLAGTETGSEDDEVLVRVTAREQLSGAREREIRQARESGQPVEAAPRPSPPARERGLAGPPREGYRSEGPRGPRGDRYDRGPRGEAFDRPGAVSEPPPPGEIEIDATLSQPADADAANFATPADAVAPIAAEILQHLLIGMRFRGRITRPDPADEAGINFQDEDTSVVLNITGLTEQDQQLLIGRRGENLTALQFMVNLLLGAQTDLWARVVVDVNGYRVRRKEALTMLAERMAERVMEQGQPYPLEPMSPYDRRIVHMALAEHPQVMTESTGEGEERRVVIMPRQ